MLLVFLEEKIKLNIINWCKIIEVTFKKMFGNTKI